MPLRYLRSGHQLADAASIADRTYLGGEVIECGCNTHARRMFEDAELNNRRIAKEPITQALNHLRNYWDALLRFLTDGSSVDDGTEELDNGTNPLDPADDTADTGDTGDTGEPDEGKDTGEASSGCGACGTSGSDPNLAGLVGLATVVAGVMVGRRRR